MNLLNYTPRTTPLKGSTVSHFIWVYNNARHHMPKELSELIEGKHLTIDFERNQMVFNDKGSTYLGREDDIVIIGLSTEVPVAIFEHREFMLKYQLG